MRSLWEGEDDDEQEQEQEEEEEEVLVGRHIVAWVVMLFAKVSMGIQARRGSSAGYQKRDQIRLSESGTTRKRLNLKCVLHTSRDAHPTRNASVHASCSYLWVSVLNDPS